MRVMIFGGTTEGREAAKAHIARGDEVIVCVTSAYAKSLLPVEAVVFDHAMDERQMAEAILRVAPDQLVDATHPFAEIASRNIALAAQSTGVPLLRIVREMSLGNWRAEVEWAADTQGAIEALLKTQGNILLTTGSKTLERYVRALPVSRIFARVLPTASVLSSCEALGLTPGQIVAMQGPFTQALNGAMYDQMKIRTLVSKDSGEVGGVTDKVLPALARGIHVIMIERPEEKPCAGNL